jgi:amino acid transporter
VGTADAAKRIVLGRKLRSTQLDETLLPKRIALPVFASDPLSSVAYSPDEIFLMLSLAGLTAYSYSWKVGLIVALVLLAVVASYRQNVQAYQSGGGDYEVANTNLGSRAGLTVASALLVDYVLTVAVSIAAAAQYAATAVPAFQGQQVAIAVCATVLLTAMNLRGVRESSTAFAIPAYLFIVAILGMAAVGFLRYLFGDLPLAATADLDVLPEEGFESGIGGIALGFLLLRAFASGCATLTGVEAISNGVPAFRKPKGKNAAATLAVLGALAVTMALSIITLANLIEVRVAEDPQQQLVAPSGELVGERFHQDPLVSQIAQSAFAGFDPGFYFVTVTTGLILVLAANTAFNGFPVLGSILARDGYLPRQLDTRGDRLAFSNGIMWLAAFAILLIVAFEAEVTRLIQLYIIGVFVSFTVSQTGMVRHWTRLLKTEADPAVRHRMQRSRLINGLGLSVTATVLVVVLVTKFTQGAWISILAMAVLFVLMKTIRQHYDDVEVELAADQTDASLPSRIHAIVLVSRLHKPTLRALAYARASRPNSIEALTVDIDPTKTAALLEEWDARGIPVPLRVLNSPYREIQRPIVWYVRSVRRASPRDVVTVFIPEYVVGHWWERLLHNQIALRLKSRLLFTPGVMMTSVPYQLRSSEQTQERDYRGQTLPGEVRRGMPAPPTSPSLRTSRPPASEHPPEPARDRPEDVGAR